VLKIILLPISFENNDDEVFVKVNNQKKFKMIENRTSQTILDKLLITYI